MFKVAVFSEGQTGDSRFLFFLDKAFATNEEAKAASNYYNARSIRSHYAYPVTSSFNP